VAVLRLFGLAGAWLKPHAPDRFANYQTRMVREAQPRKHRFDQLVRIDHARRFQNIAVRFGAGARGEIPGKLVQSEDETIPLFPGTIKLAHVSHKHEQMAPKLGPRAAPPAGGALAGRGIHRAGATAGRGPAGR
jgi:hypothetical protein